MMKQRRENQGRLEISGISAGGMRCILKIYELSLKLESFKRLKK